MFKRHSQNQANILHSSQNPASNEVMSLNVACIYFYLENERGFNDRYNLMWIITLLLKKGILTFIPLKYAFTVKPKGLSEYSIWGGGVA